MNVFQILHRCASKFTFNSNLRYVISVFHKLPISLPQFFGYNNIMDSDKLVPPASVRNMISLDRTAFQKIILIPSISVPKEGFSYEVTKKFKNCLLKVPNLKAIRSADTSEELMEVLLNPAFIKSEEDIKAIMDIDLNEMKGKFSMTEVKFTYDNWKYEQIFKAVLPEAIDTCSSFSIIGHILSLNLREHLLPYKTLIGQVYLDKLPRISLVVNKADIIDNSDNTFRSFAMEKLAGKTDETIATVKENNCTYKFDFSKVYWNPRLSTEHERIIDKLKKGDVLFDVMAGVGPFAIPAAKKKCTVFANDLNPLSYEALKDNCTINKVCNNVECFNIDGKDFIKSVIKNKLLFYLNDETFTERFHITMNLPSIAVEFLPAFSGLLGSENSPYVSQRLENEMYLPVIHVYLFSLNNAPEYVAHKVASKIGYCFKEMSQENEKEVDVSVSQFKDNIKAEFWKHVIEIINVRKVAPAKTMFRVTFRLPFDVLNQKEDSAEISHPKKIKLGL